jgi:GT2 family glycosyltransferase
MLILFPPLRSRGVRRVGLAAWRGVDDDPQFVFAPRLVGAAYLVLEVRNADRMLDPRFYLDLGKGFENGEEIELRRTRRGVYVVALRSFGRVRRVRFDPASYPARFEIVAYAGFDEASVQRFVGRKLLSATGGDERPTCETIAASADAPAIGARARKIRNVTQHFEQVVAMASAASNAAAQDAAARQGSDGKPLISFVSPVYDTPSRYLDQLLDSFRSQSLGAWELILCDDGSSSRQTIDWLAAHEGAPSLRIVRSETNGGIASATNLGLAVADGEWIALIDHDDALAPFAVERLAGCIAENPEAAFIYTDEVIADAKLHPQTYFLKPAFDPVLLTGVNYINHLSLYRRDRLRAIGGLRQGYEGSQDYDLLLRYLNGLDEKQILHMPYPAYVWRRDKKSYSVKFLDRATQNARAAIAQSYAGASGPAIVEPALDPGLHRLRFDLHDRVWPSVSVIIPSRDAFPLVSRLFDNLTSGTDYPDLEIIVVDNGTDDPRVLDLYRAMEGSRVAFRAEIEERPFNFSRQVNRGIELARGDYVLLLNNDVEVTDPGWLKEMVSCCDYPRTGIVGARLLYPDGTLQHAGVIVGLGSVAGHWFCGMPGAHPGPMGRLKVRQSLAAVTGACMLVSRPCIEAVGPFDEQNFAIAYNDIDFCMRAGRAGFRVVWTPFATLYHHESATRGSDETKENIDRFNREKEALRAKYGLADYVDPAYSPFYGRANSTPGFILPDILPPARRFEV